MSGPVDRGTILGTIIAPLINPSRTSPLSINLVVSTEKP
jgi:hypothetical protein